MKLRQQGQLLESSLGTNTRDSWRLNSSAGSSGKSGGKTAEDGASAVSGTKHWNSVFCPGHILVGTKLGFSRSWTFDYYLSNDYVLGNIWNFADFSFISFQVFSCFFWPCHRACGILVPRPGIKPMHPALEAQRQPLDHQGNSKVFLFVCVLNDKRYMPTYCKNDSGSHLLHKKLSNLVIFIGTRIF